MLMAFVPAAGCRSAPARAPADSWPAGIDPASRPAASDRRIVPEDVLQVTVFEAPELSHAVRVSERGDISLPLVGIVAAAGATPRELEVAVASRLRRYMREPHVTIEVTQPAPQPIYVLGDVVQPGAFTAAGQEPLTILRAVSVARGLKPTASQTRTVIIRTDARGERVQLPVNLGAVLRGRAPDIELLPNDVVYVPKNTERMIALGTVDALLRLVTFRAVF
jgi:polysaccharide biosynthesis/export protein